MRKKRYKTLSIALLLVLIGVSIPVPTMATNTHKDTSVDAVLKEVEEPSITSNPFMLGTKIKFRDINKSHKVNSENKVFLVNLTGGYVQAAANVSEVLYPAELSELMTVYVILKNSNLSDITRISKEAAGVKGKNVVKFGFREGDEISIKNLLSCYLLTRSDDARIALVEHVAKNESNFVKQMNDEMKKLTPMNTNFISSDGTYNENQYSLVHDLYLFMYELLQNDWFVNTMGQEKIEIEYITNSKKVQKTCVDPIVSKYGVVKAPPSFTTIAQFTSSDEQAKGNQIVIVKDKKQNYYLSILSQVDVKKDISNESAKLLRELIGEAYEDEIEVIPTATPTPSPTPSPTPTPMPTQIPLGIPTKSNNARYQYLLGTNYKDYTINNLPKGYTSAKEAEKQMKTITVPVWIMTSSGRASSTMKITVHKKLADSTMKIFKEIYALDMKFPIKKLVGYQYRKVGGVGLSNSTLMSIHAFGAAIDINPGNYDNDYFLGKGKDLRDKSNPYCIPDEVIEIFEKNGWFWGGNFSKCADTMHFQYLGLEFLTYQGKSPFRDLKVKDGDLMDGKDVKNLQQRLKELGFKVTITEKYDKATEEIIKKAQKQYGLAVTGVVDYKTWETIINLTHYMSYVF